MVYKIFINVRLLFDQLRILDIQTCSNATCMVITGPITGIGKPRSIVFHSNYTSILHLL